MFRGGVAMEEEIKRAGEIAALRLHDGLAGFAGLAPINPTRTGALASFKYTRRAASVIGSILPDRRSASLTSHHGQQCALWAAGCLRRVNGMWQDFLVGPRPAPPDP